MSHDPRLAAVRDADVAIIGMSGRFPGAPSVGEFWLNLVHGVESVRWFDDAELAAAGVDAATLAAPTYVKARATLADVELFDAEFFGFTPRQASLLDPQHRLFLECVYEGFEHAGYDVSKIAVPVGVFGGAAFNTHLIDLYATTSKGASRLQAMIHNDRDFLTSRVSHKLNLSGPSLCVQTACSTSLVAVHLACQSLIAGESEMAVAGGVSIRQMMPKGYWYQDGSILSPDGHCRTFDKRAAGTVGGDGAGVVVLKLLTAAVDDGDCIHAVIKGSAANNDGSRKVGYTAPSVTGQAEVIAAALAMSGLEPESISYIEAHGTATPLGDPIEVAALAAVYGPAATARQSACTLGAVKSNIGHLDAAAGVAGLIKTALVVRHGLLPPTLHFAEANPELRLEQTPFRISSQLQTWSGHSPRRAAVSSFGIGGTNCHAILEEPPQMLPRPDEGTCHLLPLSAKTPAALDAATANLAAHLEITSEPLCDVAYTLQVGRQAFPHRRVVVASTHEEAARALRTLPPLATTACGPQPPPIAFMFPGQGLVGVQDVRAVSAVHPPFREALREACDVLATHGREDLRTVLLATSDSDHHRLLEQTEYQQPALLAIEYALAAWWTTWGIRPAAVIGHSVGELIAACVAGVLSLDDAARLICARGSLMQRMPDGRMLAVALPVAEIAPYLNDDMQLAAVNSPRQTVVSGAPHAIDALTSALARSHVTCAIVNASRAFHSSMVHGVDDPLRDVLRTVRLHPPRVPCVSARTGRVMTDDEATDPEYWVRQLRSPVLFSNQLQTCVESGIRLFVETGVGGTLSRLVGSHAFGPAVAAIPSLPGTPTRAGGEMLDALGNVWLRGADVHWDGQARGARRVALPTYPFQRRLHRWDLSDGPVDAPVAAPLPAPAATSSAATEVLSPNQAWFFRQAFAYPNHWNQSIVLESADRVDADAIRRAFAAVVDHHDSLRLRFRREARQWVPGVAPPGGPVPCATYDLRALGPKQEESALVSLGRVAHVGLDVERGPVAKLVHLQRSADRPDVVVIIAHHLTCDMMSWEFIRADLETAYLQALEHRPIALPARTAGFLDWTRSLQKYARSEAAAVALEPSGSAGIANLSPRGGDESDEAANTVDSVRRQTVRIDTAVTRHLLEQVCPELRVQIGEVVLAAAAVSLGQWTHSSSMTVDVEAPGREHFQGGVDISRTTGWFTAVYPITVPCSDGVGIHAAVAAVRDALRQVPLGWLGYGMRQYMTSADRDPDCGSRPRARVVFGHRSLRPVSGAPPFFRRSTLRLGPDQASGNRRPYEFEIASTLQDETLTVTCLYSGAVHTDSRIGALLSLLGDRLNALSLSRA